MQAEDFSSAMRTGKDATDLDTYPTIGFRVALAPVAP
jgi:hypothetical protein